MRVIAGKCRSLPLGTIDGNGTRPTTDRIKETLFNIIQGEIPGCYFLDLFAGSGAIGIEALSRGAEYACFVEQNRQALKVIRENLAFTKLEADSDVAAGDAAVLVRNLRPKKPFDVVFIDPPYSCGLERQALEAIRDVSCVTDSTLFIVEARLGTDFSYLDGLGYRILREKKYKTNEHVFLKRKENQEKEH